MKTMKLLLSVGVLGCLALTLGAADPAAPSRVEVNFADPEGFTDLKDRDFVSDSVNAGYVRELKEHLERAAARRLPADHRLIVTIEDVDMAGDFEPWRSPDLHDVRIVKDIYPPRIDLTFQLLDANGAVVAEGRRELRDLAFNMRITRLPTNDPLRHEKTLLDDWVRREFRVAKRSS